VHFRPWLDESTALHDASLSSTIGSGGSGGGSPSAFGASLMSSSASPLSPGASARTHHVSEHHDASAPAAFSRSGAHLHASEAVHKRRLQMLEAFYAEHNPRLLGNAQGVLRKAESEEHTGAGLATLGGLEGLADRLEVKYGVRPCIDVRVEIKRH